MPSPGSVDSQLAGFRWGLPGLGAQWDRWIALVTGQRRRWIRSPGRGSLDLDEAETRRPRSERPTLFIRFHPTGRLPLPAHDSLSWASIEREADPRNRSHPPARIQTLAAVFGLLFVLSFLPVDSAHAGRDLRPGRFDEGDRPPEPEPGHRRRALQRRLHLSIAGRGELRRLPWESAPLPRHPGPRTKRSRASWISSTTRSKPVTASPASARIARRRRPGRLGSSLRSARHNLDSPPRPGSGRGEVVSGPSRRRRRAIVIAGPAHGVSLANVRASPSWSSPGTSLLILPVLVQRLSRGSRSCAPREGPR